MNQNKTFYLWCGMLGLMSLAGLGGWMYQLVYGLGVTGMNNAVSWGLYITTFMFFVGLSAGGLIVSSSATVFNIPAFKVVAKPAVILSTVCITIAAAFIVIDMGGPERIFNLILHPNFTSPLIWDVVVITVYLAVNLVYLYLMTRQEPNEKMLKRISRVALPVAILVHSVTAWIFGLQIAREGWHTALMAPLFVASALDSGLALLILVLLLLNKLSVFQVEKKLITSLAGLLAACVAVDAFFVGSEVLTMAYSGEHHAALVLGEMTGGVTAPFFWGEIVLGLLIPFLILVFAKNRENTSLIAVSSVLVVVGVFCKRVWLLLTSFIHPNVEGALGITTGRYNNPGDPQNLPDFWVTQGQYAPTLLEGIIFIGIIALGVLLFTLLTRWIIVKRSPGAKLGAMKQAVSK